MKVWRWIIVGSLLFLNQLMEYALPPLTPWEALAVIGGVEKKLGRIRTVDKGPRTLDIDIIFWGTLALASEETAHSPSPVGGAGLCLLAPA